MGVGVAVVWLCLFAMALSAAAENETSCAEKCGAKYDQRKLCQCNTKCQKYNNCCKDYTQYCQNETSCAKKCGAKYDQRKLCQCNTKCQKYNNCCKDYTQYCHVETTKKCEALTDVTEFFWLNDVNRMTPSQYAVDWQANLSDGNRTDQSACNLFRSLNESAFCAKPTLAALVVLLDNYDSIIGANDSLSPPQMAEIDQFYSLINATTIFHKLYDFLLCKGHVTNTSDFQSKFYKLWFDLYPRSSKSPTVDSSGFEHVIVGELRAKSSKSYELKGLHSWIQVYEEEKMGRLNYYGFTERVQGVPYLIGATFAWSPANSGLTAVKQVSSFFLGSSPEFDLALYTLCAFQFPNARCHVKLGGARVQIQTYDIGHESGLQIGSAYPVIE